jgi:chorismate synthase
MCSGIESLTAKKAVAIGDAALGGDVSGVAFHDEITLDDERRLARPTNRAGGLEGGVTNGQPLVCRLTMKPIATLIKPLTSVNLDTLTEEQAHFERSDVTAVPAAAVVAEAMMALVLASAVQAKFGHDSMAEMARNLAAYRNQLEPLPFASH